LVLANAEQSPLPADASGRLQLAQWLASENNPLTARVMVNRIWQWHFGQGLVRSPDNFRRLGERPTHPALLDWLARRFVESGWSIKAMHRLLILSSAHQMSTTYDPHAALVDPENRLHWRAERRRLEAEELRDAVLAVSGRLDFAQGGSLLNTKNREYVTGTSSVNATNSARQAPSRTPIGPRWRRVRLGIACRVRTDKPTGTSRGLVALDCCGL
jgi:hypothetical protein